MALTRWIGRGVARLLAAEPAAAHCDIPCGIYDPHTAQLAARTVQTMVAKIEGLPSIDGDAPAAERLAGANALARLIAVKEAHAQLCKQELLILWSDYFEPEDLSQAPGLHATFWRAVKLCSENKREVNAEKAERLIGACGDIAALFSAKEARKAQQAKATTKVKAAAKVKA